MRRTFTLQMHDRPSKLPLLCPGCSQVCASGENAQWWTNQGLIPWCNDCNPDPPPNRKPKARQTSQWKGDSARLSAMMGTGLTYKEAIELWKAKL